MRARASLNGFIVAAGFDESLGQRLARVAVGGAEIGGVAQCLDSLVRAPCLAAEEAEPEERRRNLRDAGSVTSL